MEHKPLRQVLDFTATSNNGYEFEFPSSVCYGVVVSGGIVMAAIHRAAADFVTKDSRTAFHTDVVNVALQFYRPTLPAPHKSAIDFQISNVNRAVTVLHVQLSQQKICVTGYVTLTSLSFPGYLWQAPNAKLDPAPLPTSIQSLESDRDTNWIGYYSPLELCGSQKVQSYVRVHIPRREELRYKNDAWITTGWEDQEQPNGAVWTNELVHFVLDNGVPPHADLMHDDKTRRVHDQIVAAGLAQRKARLEGESDHIRGEGLSDEEAVPYTIATLTVSTEIKKLLPEDGVKWLFMRSQTRGILNNRMDLDITVLDEGGDIVAISHHIAILIPLSSKNARL